ncbi:MAG: DHH family phosphoesterase [Spirochaetaceae bacterium]|jgi:nanoRNase/pAp phosphatase (c-di-AMP/oligoRNAs hydrolase)|nr:DHH family phosphoesterase [Spirochaetaceae bacterium]
MDKTKVEIKTIAEKNRIINRIGEVILEGESFLILGHKDPETDCIASMVSVALLLSNFQKEVTVYLAGPMAAHFTYLLAICKYRGISVAYGKLPNTAAFTTIMIVDTAKPEMLTVNSQIDALLKDDAVRKVEIDHHLGRDACYSGDEGYCLVSAACSTCELIGQLLLKLAGRKDKYGEIEFSRNLILSIITGIVGDSQIGKYLTTRREKLYYRIFTELFDKLMGGKAPRGKSLSSMEAVFDVIQNFSVREKRCFDAFMEMRNTEKTIHYISIDPSKSAELFEEYGTELIVNVSKAVVDTLAETSGKLGLVAYYDAPSLSDFVQFRLRRSSKFLHVDLRSILAELNIENGGGHPGAVGFRILKESVTEINSYVEDMVTRIETLAGSST